MMRRTALIVLLVLATLGVGIVPAGAEAPTLYAYDVACGGGSLIGGASGPLFTPEDRFPQVLRSGVPGTALILWGGTFYGSGDVKFWTVEPPAALMPRLKECQLLALQPPAPAPPVYMDVNPAYIFAPTW